MLTTSTDNALAGYLATHSPYLSHPGLPSVILIMNELLSTSKVRLGPLPAPDNAEAMQAVVASVSETGRPIPILMPWGSKKPDNGTVDVAEVGALKTLIDLHDRITSVYSPGIELRMRIEDTSGDYLFKEEGPAALEGSALYVREFDKLLKVVGLPFIKPKKESDMLDTHAYLALVEMLRKPFMEYLSDTSGFGIVDDPSLQSWRTLSNLGWKGFIPEEQREFYLSRYRLSFPDYQPEDLLWKLAGYFASILARIKMRGYGAEDWGKEFINLSFAPPVPGTPDAFAQRRLYYRTLPVTEGKTHLAPWRARGYLRTDGAGRLRFKLSSFHEDLDLVPETAVMAGNGESVVVRAPRLLPFEKSDVVS